jgi:hypothetical protein
MKKLILSVETGQVHSANGKIFLKVNKDVHLGPVFLETRPFLTVQACLFNY